MGLTRTEILLVLFSILLYYGAGVGLMTIVGSIGLALNIYNHDMLYNMSMIGGIFVGIGLYGLLERIMKPNP